MHIAKMKNNNADYIFEIREEDQNNLLENMELLDLFDDIVIIPGSIIWRNIQQLKSYISITERLISEQGMDFLFDMSVHKGELIRNIMNILTSFRTYSDIVAHRIKECFYNTDIAEEVFKERQSAMFDSHFYYRFLSRFRNYVQHYGLPLDDLVIDLESDIIHYDITIKKDKIITYKDWGSIKQEVLNLDDNIQIGSYVLNLYESIDYIQKGLVDIFIAERKEIIDSMLLLYSNAKEVAKDYQFVVIYPNKSNGANIRYFNTPLFEMLINYTKKNA